MMRQIVGFALLLAGIVGVNCAAGCASQKEREAGAGLLAPDVRAAIDQTKRNSDDLATSPVPYVSSIAATLSALLGGVIMIDRMGEKKERERLKPNGSG